MSDGLQRVGITRVSGGLMARGSDLTVVEEPLEVRVHGEPLAVIMRTPGADVELAAGFLLSERVVTTSDELGTIRRCSIDADPDLDDTDPDNVVDATLVGVDVDDRMAERRRVMTNSSCGLCGRTTIESLRAEAPPIEADWTIGPAVISALPGRLRAAQALFAETGGLHAAALFDREGRLVDFAEDVGRHNAVDKIIGRKFLDDALPLRSSLLFVSGRASFEIVQKAFVAGVPMVAAVSAPSSLAVELADEAGMTLVGFVRGETFNVYSHSWRVVA